MSAGEKQEKRTNRLESVDVEPNPALFTLIEFLTGSNLKKYIQCRNVAGLKIRDCYGLIAGHKLEPHFTH